MQQYSDRARRCADTVNMHILAHKPAEGGPVDWNGPTPWIAVNLSDGRSDGVLYSSKAEAIRHQIHETQCAYLTIPPDGMTYQQAEVYLKFTEQMYEAGVRLADPDMQVQLPVRAETNASVIAQLKEKK